MAASTLIPENRNDAQQCEASSDSCARLTQPRVILTAIAIVTLWIVMFAKSATAEPVLFQANMPDSVPEQLEPTRLQLPDAIVTSQTEFDIPFNTDDLDGRLIEVQLYVSTDLGKSWNLYSRQSPQVKKIPFESVGDGEYLFALKTLDRDRRLLPIGPPIPTLRIAVDTAKPELQLQIDPDKEGRVSATWRAIDSNLDPRSLSLSYRIAETNASPNWLPVPTGTSIDANRQADPNVHQDRVVWWPDTNANAIIIKAEIKDHAGNLATVFQPVGLSAFRPTPTSLPAVATSQLSPPDPRVVGEKAVAAYKPAVSQNNAPQTGPIPWPVDGPPVASGAVGNLAYAPRKDASGSNESGKINDDPFRSLIAGQSNSFQQPALGSDATSGLNNMVVAQGSTLQHNALAPDQPTLADPRSQFIPQTALAALKKQNNSGEGGATSDLAGPQSPSNSAPAKSGVASSFISHRNESPEEKSNSSIPDRPQLPPTFSQRPSNQRVATSDAQAKTNPDAGSGNSGSVDFAPFDFAPGTYFVVNQKQFRLRYHVDGLNPNQIGSVAIFGSVDMGKTWRLWTTDIDKVSPVSIEVPDQGRYAFRVVVTNLGGLASEIPASGARPELVVDVDLTSPTPRIVAAPYGKDPTQASVMIQWECNDQDLDTTPVAIAYSDSPRGPWTTITQATANNGAFKWLLHPNLPTEVYLRMAVTDKAGNKGYHQLRDPINLAPLIPRGRILGLER